MWHTLEWLLNTLLFQLTGLIIGYKFMDNRVHAADYGWAVVTYLSLILIRFAGILLLTLTLTLTPTLTLTLTLTPTLTLTLTLSLTLTLTLTPTLEQATGVQMVVASLPWGRQQPMPKASTP